MKFYIYQVIAISIIWFGMAFFFSELSEASKIIFYIVSSWLLFLIVLLVKYVVTNRKVDK
ncbi:hypothetical protein SAMN05216389_11043 [Oceanobacillus limi]|uniref:Uncharacterized protein n=1 Tax=Oceanobacillus limi TaxID=930131 RepID=A0A1I0E0M0_9BACI|nr:hypothetical protein [Oceanobacillus limi]SET38421.1 hypothetical protein SAMN05216389_11043 [Oceanobacillus limi]